ncbi:tRNA 2-thiocytidine biosynthesis TtcA family protein [Chlamydiales bacterium]|nr:tRNA 2-thiocytidine biosynthesis TtcA family protein [Chlamydiales bacterium]
MKSTKLAKKIESGIRKALHEFNLIPEEGKIAVALSGGKDSITLLKMLKRISGYGFPPFELYALHVTGEFSCGAGLPSKFLTDICDELEVPLIVRDSTQKLETLECYSCSRERRALLFDAAHSVGATHIAFGHHRDDNIQTMLMNLLKKGEFAGMLAKLFMQRFNVTITRPLILIPEEDITSYAEQEGFLRISCRCPRGVTSMRKKVDELIDQMEHLFPHVRKNLSHAILNYGSNKAARSLIDGDENGIACKSTGCGGLVKLQGRALV